MDSELETESREKKEKAMGSSTNRPSDEPIDQAMRYWRESYDTQTRAEKELGRIQMELIEAERTVRQAENERHKAEEDYLNLFRSLGDEERYAYWAEEWRRRHPGSRLGIEEVKEDA